MYGGRNHHCHSNLASHLVDVFLSSACPANRSVLINRHSIGERKGKRSRLYSSRVTLKLATNSQTSSPISAGRRTLLGKTSPHKFAGEEREETGFPLRSFQMKLLSETNVPPVSEKRGTSAASNHRNGQKMGKKESGFHSRELVFLRSGARKGCRSEGFSRFAQH